MAPCAAAWQRAIPGAGLRVVPDTGHVPHLEAPAVVAGAVIDFCVARELSA